MRAYKKLKAKKLNALLDLPGVDSVLILPNRAITVSARQGTYIYSGNRSFQPGFKLNTGSGVGPETARGFIEFTESVAEILGVEQTSSCIDRFRKSAGRDD